MASSADGSGLATWQPQEEGLREICGLLEQQMAPTSDDKSLIWQKLQHYTQFPDFNNYLAFIFARAEVRFIFLSLVLSLLNLFEWFLVVCCY